MENWMYIIIQTYQNAKDYILSVFMLFSSGLHYVNLFVATKKKLKASVLNSKLNLDFFVHIRNHATW